MRPDNMMTWLPTRDPLKERVLDGPFPIAGSGLPFKIAFVSFFLGLWADVFAQVRLPIVRNPRGHPWLDSDDSALFDDCLSGSRFGRNGSGAAASGGVASSLLGLSYFQPEVGDTRADSLHDPRAAPRRIRVRRVMRAQTGMPSCRPAHAFWC